MPDQAEHLRQFVRTGIGERPWGMKDTRLIAVASGKGGVGKSNIVLNFALALQGLGERIAVLDADLGFANLDILLGLHPRHSLQDVFEGKVSLQAALTQAQRGLSLVSGGSGIWMDEVNSHMYLTRFATELSTVDGHFDRIFIDFGAGFGRQTAELMGLCDELLIVSTPEPTALADAYALLKLVSLSGHLPHLQLIVNRARTVGEAAEAARKFTLVAQKFIRVETDLLGYVLEDGAVTRAVSRQTPFVLCEPHSMASRCIVQLARNAMHASQVKPVPARGLKAFFDRFRAKR